MRHLCAAIFARHGDAAQSACRIAFDLSPRQPAFAVAFCRTQREVGGQLVRGGNGLGIVMNAGRAYPPRRLIRFVVG